MKGGVFIAMPVFRGTEFVEETLRSILAQTYSDWHLVMSVDGADDPTVEICRKYEEDPRIDVVVQETRLGWPGNFNWLVENCDREFFCYWQQDDLTSTGYLESLRRELLARPDAAIAYTDVQWFGARFDRNRTPSIEGDPLSRVMQHIEAIGYGPLRGLMRSSMLPSSSEAIPVTEDESCQEEFVFLTHMAAAGAFVRVETAMYFKRLHTSNVFVRWTHFPNWRRRRGWISMGVGMYHTARALAAPELRPRILSQIIDRLVIERHGRAHFYLPTQSTLEIHLFVRDFVAFGEIAATDLALAGAAEALERPIHLAVLGALAQEEARAQTRADLQLRLEQGDSLTVAINEEEGEAFLGFGWSATESWGVWSDGGRATLRIPAPPGRSWRAYLLGQVYGTTDAVPFSFGTPNGPLLRVEAQPNQDVSIVVESDGEDDVVRLELPWARSPKEDGASEDERALGFGLMRLTVELT